MIGFGRLFIANPDLPERIRTGAELIPWIPPPSMRQCARPARLSHRGRPEPALESGWLTWKLEKSASDGFARVCTLAATLMTDHRSLPIALGLLGSRFVC